MEDQKQEQKPEPEDRKFNIIASIISFLYFAYIIWLIYGFEHTEVGQRPFFVAVYLFGFLLCNIISFVLMWLSKKERSNKYFLFFEYHEEQLEAVSPFGRWYAKYEGAFCLAFVLEIMYFVSVLFYLDVTTYFNYKYLLHIAWGIWLLVSTTVAVCGFISLRKVRKIERDTKSEPSAVADEDADVSSVSKVYKPLIFIVILPRLVLGIWSLILWL